MRHKHIKLLMRYKHIKLSEYKQYEKSVELNKTSFISSLILKKL